ncbi:Gfo/Idh/MocA family protein [Paenibacillus eucommiae]|uniref:Dehydrogenase n=1 Tax=Paenibacillus eucommiae TaxID=1355755 RepID=A0ABS4J120_9BACL|nr:Gfo/Idh/MocA family oxidoreductase [Paenibacillus eucommiae]MBP1993529.1 putative dehydrogenase [Paenibacillus eucommiae]
MNKLKVGMISFAHGHAFSYLNSFLALPNVEIVGIADDNKERVEEAVNRHEIPYFADYRDLLAADVDAVVICSENVHHAPMVIAAAKAKKHVLCEKPLGVSVEEMSQMIAACKENGVQLMTAFPCRYLAAVVSAKQIVESGEIGDIVAIKGFNRGTFPGGWFAEQAKSGGGALLDHTVHVMDLMNWFIGSKVSEVYAYAARLFQENIDVDDIGMIHVKFDNGAFGVLDTSWSRPKSSSTGGDVAMEIVGTKGNLTVDGFAQANEFYSDDRGKGVMDYWGDSMDHYMVEAFVKALLDGDQVPISGEDGLYSAEVALAGYASVKSGQPVRI